MNGLRKGLRKEKKIHLQQVTMRSKVFNINSQTDQKTNSSRACRVYSNKLLNKTLRHSKTSLNFGVNFGAIEL